MEAVNSSWLIFGLSVGVGGDILDYSFFLSFKKIEVQLIHNIILISGVQHNDSEFLQIILL